MDKQFFSMMVGVMMMAVMAAVVTSGTGAQQKGYLVVNTTPPGASVSLNGSLAGTSPATMSISPGTYSVLVQLDGYNSVSTSVTIEAGSTYTLNMSLTVVGGEWVPIDILWT